MSISSGGENVFAILLKNPKKVVAIDINKEQIYLTKLKVAAIRNLDFNKFVQFIGFKKSPNRISLFDKIKESLSNDELIYWNTHQEEINTGIIHTGKLERYLGKFRKFLLPLVISKSSLNRFLQLNTLKEQEDFFNKVWNNWRFRFLFKLFFSEKGMSNGRKKDYFKYSKQTRLTSYYFEKTRNGLTKIPIKSNFFMQYILTGTIPIPFEGHPYLDKNNFNKLKNLFNKVEFVNADIQDYMRKTKKGKFTKFNLSDIFELKEQEEYEEILKEIVRVSNHFGIVCYWNNLAPRYNHNKIPGLRKDESLSKELSKKDRCHFYSRFIVEKIRSSKI